MALSSSLQGLIFAGANYYFNKYVTNNYIDVFSFTAKNFELSGIVETSDYKNNQGDTMVNFLLNKPRTINMGEVVFKNIVTGKKNKNNYDYGLSALFLEGLKARQKLAPLFIKSLQFSGAAILKDYSISNYDNQIINLTFEEVFIFVDTVSAKINGVVATPTPQLVKVVGV